MKNVISQSDNLLRLRSAYRRHNVIEALLLSFFIYILYAIYVFLVYLGRGKFSFMEEGNEFLSNLPYFDLSHSLYEFDVLSVEYRWLLLLGVFVFGLLVGFAYWKLHYSKLNRKYRKQYEELLLEEAKINGLIVLNKEYKQVTDEDKRTMDLLNINEYEITSEIEVSTSMTSWSGKQVYIKSGKSSFPGFLLQCELQSVKTHALVELRTFGDMKIRQYQGLSINRYGFGNVSSLSNFICYTTLGQEIYLFIDKKVVEAISSFAYFVKTDMLVLIEGSKLSIYLSGFELKLTKPLKAKLDERVLETQAEALVALHQCLLKTAVSLQKEVAFAPEEKGNGLI